jgi:uncharacterized delta-60 repeat protein
VGVIVLAAACQGPFVVPTPLAVTLSAGGRDQLQSVTAGPNGTFYAAGFSAADVTGPQHVTVVKLMAAGGLDLTFGGGDGIASTTVEFRGGSDEIDIATQPDGKIIVTATVANASSPDDRDIAVLRFKADGTLDSTFGTAGVQVLDLSTAHHNGSALVGLDAPRAVAVDSGGRIYVHGQQRGEGNAAAGGPRTDTDFVVVRLAADGTLDASFGGGDGKHLLDIQEANATARTIAVLPDGSVLGSGYANSPDLGSTQPVLYKLTSAGELDTSFATAGLFHDTVLTVQTEIYSFVIHGSSVVTAGYGRDSGTTNDWVSLRFDVATGRRDTTWGGAAKGVVLVDPSGAALGSNCRSAVGLPNGKTVLLGSTGPGNSPAQDAAFAVLDSSGRIDTAAYEKGVYTFQLGQNGLDQFWGGAVSGENLMLVGYEGRGASQTATVNDNAYAVVMPVR